MKADSADRDAGHSWNATLYDDKHAFVWKHGASLLELLAAQPGERILDLGCGTGHLTSQLAAAGAEVLGIDNAPTMIDQARRLYPQLHFELADARDFTVAEPFDAVFSNAVLHWIKEPAQVVACVHRTLKPGGRFVAEFGGQGNVRALVAGLASACQAVSCPTPGDLWYFPSIGAYATLLEQQGLEVTAATLFERPTPLEGEQGMRHWVEMFASDLLRQVPSAQRAHFLRHVEDTLRPVLYRAGQWFADYRRLRVVAYRA
ncbi:MAG: methyltransferase domain-containing protein [Gemmataceae bacterium]|nr:methyltransferase domain-containing protein [Gemmataceae bacterium]